MTTGTNANAAPQEPRAAQPAERAEDVQKHEAPGAAGFMQRMGDVMKTPSVGASITGALVLGVAATFGVLEAAIAAGAAYGAYRILRKKRPA
jgi:hypothetical protein